MNVVNEAIHQALERDTRVDITTIGRKSGRPHRVEVGLRQLDGQVYLLTTQGLPRDWAANLLANPEFTCHLKQSVQADLKAKATHVPDLTIKRELYREILANQGRLDELEARVRQTTLFRVDVMDVG